MDDTVSSKSSIGSVDASIPLPLTFAKWRDACMASYTAAANKDKVRSKATAIFAFLSNQLEHETPQNVVIKTKSSHNEALAQLVQELGPAFLDTASYSNRICALYCMCGAIEGCAKQAGLSDKIVNLLGAFFLGQCGPLEPEDGNDEDSDELVRDAAVMCLSSLAKSRRDKEESSRNESRDQAIKTRLELAKKGVERRCASSDTDEMDYDHGYDFPSAKNNDIRGGLSSLPRSRRSLCFDLVRATLDGLDSMNGEEELGQSAVTTDLASFASFAATCLHGESDPRCLMQVLRMLHVLQLNMLSFFQAESAVRFPVMDVFDAVAPYYPIHFNPPPNDVHGITRQGLHDALMSVLCFTSYDSLAPDKDSTMLNLTAGIFLERLISLDHGDGTAPSTVEDKLEAVKDLTALLLREDGSRCDQMSDHTVKELSVALLATHEESASGALSGGEKGRMNKSLADACRSLVSSVASSLEVSRQSNLWTIFVRDPVRMRSSLLSTSPQSAQGRSSIAYLACLAASGGPRTLKLCLQSCLPLLIDILTKEVSDEEKVAAAVHGIGAFFSSVLVAFARGMKEGVVFHPHPLEPYSAKTLRALCDLVGTHNGRMAPVAVSIAAVRALDSVLSVTPAALLDDDDIDKLCSIFDELATLVESDNAMAIDDSLNDGTEIESRKAASRTIGAVLGKAFEYNGADAFSCSPSPAARESILVQSEKLRNHLCGSIYPNLISSSKRIISFNNETELLRFDWNALVCACEISQGAANQILSDLTNLLNDSFKHRDTVNENTEVALARLFWFMIQRGGTNAIAAFRSLSAPNASPMDLIESLCSISPSSEQREQATASPEKTVVSRVSTLMLPPTSEDKQEVDAMVGRAYQILPFLLPAYEYPFSQSQMENLLRYVSHVLPPLNDWQNGQLCVALSILSVALSQSTPKLMDPDENSSAFESLEGIAPYLTDCALSSDLDRRARSAAASCLYYVITKFQKSDSTECLSKRVLSDCVIPRILQLTEEAKGPKTGGNAVDTLYEALFVAAAVGTAAAVVGRSSSQIADGVALFLLQLSCDGSARAPFLGDEQIVVFDVLDEAATLHFAASSAFGSMISIEDGGPFWRQRLVHLASRHVLGTGEERDSQRSLTPLELGRLMISCYVVASSSVTALGETALIVLTDSVLMGLSDIYAEDSVTRTTIQILGPRMFSMKELALSAVLKLIAATPNVVAKYCSVLVSSLLRAYADDCPENPMIALPCQMLALQGLLNVTLYFHQAKRSLLSIKPVVLSVLATASDHPSSALRNAAVEARNAWFVLE